jgi:hypothetical protein
VDRQFGPGSFGEDFCHRPRPFGPTPRSLNTVIQKFFEFEQIGIIGICAQRTLKNIVLY